MQKRGSILLSIFILLLVSNVNSLDYEVTRQINSSQVEVDGTVEVTLYVDVGESDAYAIDEQVPEGWVIIESPEAIQKNNHLMWIVCGQQGNNYSCLIDCCVGSINDINYTYALQAPSIPEIAVISGEYIFDTQKIKFNLPDDTIEVTSLSQSLCTFYDYDETACLASEDCDWCPLNNNCEFKTRIECNESRCYGDEKCSEFCQLSSCRAGQQCVDNNCEITSSVCCTPDWQCTDWPSQCSEDTLSRTCTDLNNCSESYTESRSCRRATTSPQEETASTPSTYIRTPVPIKDEIISIKRTRQVVPQELISTFPRTKSTRPRETLEIFTSEFDKDSFGFFSGSEPERKVKTPEEILIEDSKTADMSFYGLLAIWIVLGILILLYYVKRKGNFHKSKKVDKLSHIRSIKQLQEKYEVLDVDAFLDLVRKKGTIGLPEVAKKLNVPLKTVEAIANQLVKEGFLGIQYKFTTAYVYMEKE